MHLIFLALAKDEGFYKEGLTILNNLRHIPEISEDMNIRVQLMDAQLSWLMDDKLIANHILHTICKNPQVNPKYNSESIHDSISVK